MADVMDRDLHLLHEEEDLPEVITILRTTGRLWLPVVNGLGDLVGLLSRDDLLEILGEQLAELVSLSGDSEASSRQEEARILDRFAASRQRRD